MKEILERIAKQALGVETLETRNADRLDFYDLPVWCVLEALEAAYKAGASLGAPITVESVMRWGPGVSIVLNATQGRRYAFEIEPGMSRTPRAFAIRTPGGRNFICPRIVASHPPAALSPPSSGPAPDGLMYLDLWKSYQDQWFQDLLQRIDNLYKEYLP